MAQVLVRDVAPDIVNRLKLRAQRNQRSLEAELRIIFEDAVQEPAQDRRAEVERIRALFAGRQFSDSAALLREDRDR
jgi:plasmid stability protein